MVEIGDFFTISFKDAKICPKIHFFLHFGPKIFFFLHFDFFFQKHPKTLGSGVFARGRDRVSRNT